MSNKVYSAYVMPMQDEETFIVWHIENIEVTYFKTNKTFHFESMEWNEEKQDWFGTTVDITEAIELCDIDFVKGFNDIREVYKI